MYNHVHQTYIYSYVVIENLDPFGRQPSCPNPLSEALLAWSPKSFIMFFLSAFQLDLGPKIEVAHTPLSSSCNISYLLFNSFSTFAEKNSQKPTRNVQLPYHMRSANGPSCGISANRSKSRIWPKESKIWREKIERGEIHPGK